MAEVFKGTARRKQNVSPRLTAALLKVAGVIGLIIVLAPLLVVVGAALNRTEMSFPPSDVSAFWMLEALRQPDFLEATRTSFVLALAASSVSTACAIPVALALRRMSTGNSRLLSLIFLGPLLVPSVILALALYQVIMTLLGFASVLMLFLGHVIITLPFPIRTISAAAETLDPALEDAAASVGAGPFRTFVSVTFPLIKSGVIAGILFAFIASWNDFSISIFLSPPEFTPLPIKIYAYLQYEYRPLIAAVSTWLIFLSALVVFAIDRLVGLNVFVGRRA